MKTNNIFSMLKNLQLSKDKLLLILLGGVLLVIVSLPVKEKSSSQAVKNAQGGESTEVNDVSYGASDYESELELRLEEVLSQAEGAGRVRVFITFKDSGELIVKSDVSESARMNDGGQLSESTREEKVIFKKEGDGTLTPYVTKTIYPEISGVLVLAEGASDAGVVARLTEAVSAVLGIEINKIRVMKMEG